MHVPSTQHEHAFSLYATFAGQCPGNTRWLAPRHREINNPARARPGSEYTRRTVRITQYRRRSSKSRFELRAHIVGAYVTLVACRPGEHLLLFHGCSPHCVIGLGIPHCRHRPPPNVSQLTVFAYQRPLMICQQRLHAINLPSIIYTARVMPSVDSILRGSHAAERDVFQQVPTQRKSNIYTFCGQTLIDICKFSLLSRQYTKLDKSN